MASKFCSYSLLALLAMTFFTTLLSAQTSAELKNPETAVSRSWKFGTEIDLLPYVMNGYYASAFTAHAGWRFRGVVARSDAPSFLVSSGFDKKRNDAYALLVDRFVGKKRDRLEGFWAGAGAELWRSRIRQEGTSDFTRYNNTVLTAGGGYVWRLSNHFYVNPWSAIHVVAAGDRTINVSGKAYEQPRLTPEASVKFGIVF
jgi:hypothetical protein